VGGCLCNDWLELPRGVNRGVKERLSKNKPYYGKLILKLQCSVRVMNLTALRKSETGGERKEKKNVKGRGYLTVEIC